MTSSGLLIFWTVIHISLFAPLLQTAYTITFKRAHCYCLDVERSHHKRSYRLAFLAFYCIPLSLSHSGLPSLFSKFHSQCVCYPEQRASMMTEAAWKHCAWERRSGFTAQSCWKRNKKVWGKHAARQLWVHWVFEIPGQRCVVSLSPLFKQNNLTLVLLLALCSDMQQLANLTYGIFTMRTECIQRGWDYPNP